MDKAWDMLFDELLAAREELTRRICEALLEQLAVYRTIPREALDVEVWLEVEPVLQAARSNHTRVARQDFSDLATIGETRAQQGLPLSDMLGAWRIGAQLIIGYARELGQRLGIENDQLLDFVQSLLAWADVALVTITEAHRRAELAIALADETVRAEFVRGTLFGTVPNTQLRIQAEGYGLDPAGEYVAVRARFREGDSAHKLQQQLDTEMAQQRRRGLTALIDGDIAGFLSEPPPEDIDGVVGFGPPKPLEGLAESHRLAVRALLTAQACGLEGAHDISSLGLRVAVATDKDVGELLRKRYLEPLEAGGSARELLGTLREYLACGMHVGQTAKRLFVHQNTVRYRLARFEELTGAGLADTEVLVEVWWVLELSAMRL